MSALVVRRANPADRRVNVLTLTPKGRHVRDELVTRLFDPPEALRGGDAAGGREPHQPQTERAAAALTVFHQWSPGSGESCGSGDSWGCGESWACAGGGLFAYTGGRGLGEA